MAGKVYLVGAGPGDPELITRKGLALIKKADVIVYDYLVNIKLLKFAKKSCENVSWKRFGPFFSDKSSVRQEKINKLLIKRAMAGKKVVRLKCGDPFIFGRGGQEAEALADAGISYEVIPGVSAGIAAAALSRVPLTDRRFASTVTFVTGHEDPAKLRSLINWKGLARKGTLVFYMGVERLPLIVKQLVQHGKKKQTPVLIVENVSRKNERTTSGTLKDIVGIAKKMKVAPPAIIIVGEVVSLREKLWQKGS
jgi:uroporphyrin-III C-methyltransferase